MKSFLYIPLIIFTSTSTLFGAALNESALAASSSGQELIQQENQVYHLTSLCLASIEPETIPDWFPQLLLDKSFEMYCEDVKNDPKNKNKYLSYSLSGDYRSWCFGGGIIRRHRLDRLVGHQIIDMQKINDIKDWFTIAVMRDEKLLKAYINSRKDVNLKINNEPAFNLALIGQTPQSINILLKAGADPNAKNTEDAENRGEPALIFAINCGMPDIALELIKAGADSEVRNHDGKTIADLANAKIEITKMLKSKDEASKEISQYNQLIQICESQASTNSTNQNPIQ